MKVQPADRINRSQNWRKDGLLSINYRAAGDTPLSKINREDLSKGSSPMKAYVIAAETVNDPAMFDLYRKQVPATLIPFDGQFIVRGASLTVLEGEWPQPRLVIIEFPSRAAAEEWYNSAEYRKIISLRLKSSAGNLIIVDGFADQ
jgi:uncharacterized protein (DUF1330 family)